MPFVFSRDTTLRDVLVIQPKIFADDRGFFLESYKKSDFNGWITEDFIQDNHSRSKKGTLRGIHYQLPPFAQGKLVRCVRGEIFDVAVDLRKESPDFGKWVSIILSAENKTMFYIPPGFGHAFYAVSDDAEIAYKTTAEYSALHDRGIIWNDPDLNIAWPKGEKFLSPKDQALPGFRKAEVF